MRKLFALVALVVMTVIFGSSVEVQAKEFPACADRKTAIKYAEVDAEAYKNGNEIPQRYENEELQGYYEG